MTGMGIPRLTVSKILNHAESSVTAIYDRYSYDLEKRQALLAWGAHVARIVSGATSEQRFPPEPYAERPPLSPPTSHDYPPSIH